MNGLIIHGPWIDYILNGSKTWEMRSKSTHQRGTIGLIRKGTGLVVGAAELTDCLPPLDAASFARARSLHGIPPDQDAEVIARGWVRPWVLRNVRRLPRPVLAGQIPGQVTWVPLSNTATAAIVDSGWREM